jgi:hypothetical protein
VRTDHATAGWFCQDEPDQAGMPSTSRTAGDLRILVVELDTAAGLASLLRRFGHRVQVSSDRDTAWQAALRDAPHVVLLDLAMPGTNGWSSPGGFRSLCGRRSRS